jgi:adenylate kinase
MLPRKGQSIGLVLRLVVDDTKLIDRVEKRFAEQGRADDNPESFKKRLTAYNRDTAPLVPIYKAQGKLVEVDGMAGIEDVASAIAKAIDARA